jgi:surface polysaccharide O-acyltransferase-like enzyme
MSGYKDRSSNIELLRLVSMFLVLTLHGYGVALGLPSKADFQISPLSVTVRSVIESLSIVCVNVFVLISGWFGIKPGIKGFASFLFQCLFFSACISVFAPLFGIGEPFSWVDIGHVFFFGNYYYWFVKCYLCLYILSPVLNAFIQSADRKTFLIVLLGFFVIQTFYGWTGAMGDFDRGYSVVSFVGLYLLARFIKLYGRSVFRFNKWMDLFLYIGLSFILAAAYIVSITQGLEKVASHLFVYINPLVIASSVFLLLFFSKINIKSITINYLAQSAFAVYLLHLNTKIWDSFLDTCYNLYVTHSFSRAILLILFFISAVFAIAILIDQIRLLLWKPLKKVFASKQTGK